MLMKKRAISFLLVVASLFGVSGAAYAVEPRASYTLDSYYLALIAKDNGRMGVVVSINGVGVQDKIGVREISIDHKTRASADWTYYDSLYGADHPDFYAYDARSYDEEIYFNGVPGEIYRVTITAYAKKGDKSDTGHVAFGSTIYK